MALALVSSNFSDPTLNRPRYMSADPTSLDFSGLLGKLEALFAGKSQHVQHDVKAWGTSCLKNFALSAPIRFDLGHDLKELKEIATKQDVKWDRVCEVLRRNPRTVENYIRSYDYALEVPEPLRVEALRRGYDVAEEANKDLRDSLKGQSQTSQDNPRLIPLLFDKCLNEVEAKSAARKLANATEAAKQKENALQAASDNLHNINNALNTAASGRSLEEQPTIPTLTVAAHSFVQQWLSEGMSKEDIIAAVQAEISRRFPNADEEGEDTSFLEAGS